MDNKLIALIVLVAVVAIGAAVFAIGAMDNQNSTDDSSDSGTSDSGTSDSGSTDSGTSDSGTSDSGSTDSGTSDSGSTDSGTSDSGTGDSGTTDSGTEDSGTTGSEITDTTTVSGVTIVYTGGDLKLSTPSNTSGETTLQIDVLKDAISFSIAGEMTGNILVNAGEFDAEMNLTGFTITSSHAVPIYVADGSDFDISAKSKTDNYVYDYRSEVDEAGTSAAIYSECDLTIKGAGTLTVGSEYNNGIHTKDDLKVQKLTLTVTCVDNALKGNDSVTIKSGTLSLTATSGDGIKTSNTSKSDGTACGDITINSVGQDTSVTIKALCDAIDSASDILIGETYESSITMKVYTSTYARSITSGPMNMMPGWGNNQSGWQPGGGMEDGNTDKQDYSCKGLKAGGTISVNNGTISITAYDDALHADSISILGGTFALASNDDGIHADTKVTVSGGTISVTKSYEAIEGGTIEISGGEISVRSSDDGVNATSGGLTLSGGYLYVYAGGDGLDTNNSSIRFNGTNVVIVSTSSGNSAIDADYSYTYTKGVILAICPNGMIQEITGSSTFSSYGKMKSLGNISSGTIVSASVSGTVMAAVKMPTSMSSAVAFYIGSSSASISTASSASVSLDDNGVYFRT